MTGITLFQAKKILTMDRNNSAATHVAVKDGRVLATGDAQCAAGWGEAKLDDRFKNDVMMPGLIEAHAHVSAGGVWRFTYCGHYTRFDPNGGEWPGIGDADALIERLRRIAQETPTGQPVVGWGFDPNFLPPPRLDKSHLDHVSQDHPVILIHSNMHLLTCNTKALAAANMSNGSNIHGVMQGTDGLPNGEMQEFAAMGPIMDVGNVRLADLADEDSLRAYGRVAQRCGVTTVADLLSDLDPDELDMVVRVTADTSFPVRYVPIMNAMRGEPQAEAARALALREHSHDKLSLGRAKLFTDGAIQGRTAMLKPPGYFTGEDYGMMNMAEGHFRQAVKALHKAGVKTHIHTNGDAASELGINAIADAMREAPSADIRHTLEHVQLADRSQFQRMANLGITANLFGNHLYYFGDVHWNSTLGPDRARRMNGARDALEVFNGNFAIHSDAPVTPMAPLFTAWCVVNRQTEKGLILGDSQQIQVSDALYCITMGAAYVLGLEDRVGSISTGKFADFCVLEDDPMSVDAAALKDIPVKTTILGGESI